MKIVLLFFILINSITFFLFGIDKYLARKNFTRISEKTLLSLTVLGGSIGALFAQSLFRHKTKKFKYIIWIIFLIQVITLVGTLRWTSGSN